MHVDACRAQKSRSAEVEQTRVGEIENGEGEGVRAGGGRREHIGARERS